MGKRIASLFAEIGIDTVKLQKGLQDTKDKLKAFGGKLSETTQKVTGLNLSQLGTVAVMTAVAKGISDSIRKTMAYADTVRELSRVNGASAEETSRVIQMTDDLGLSLEELNTASTMAARQGITLTTGSLADLSAQFLALETPAERNAFALEKFGRSGLNMIKVLEAGPEKIRDMSAAVGESLILTDAQVKAARELEIAQDNLNDTWAGMKTQLAVLLIPELSKFLDTMNRGITTGNKLVNWNKNINNTYQDHQKEVIKTSGSYQEYVREMIRSNEVIGKLVKITGLNTDGVMANKDELAKAIDKLGIYSEATYDAARSTDYADRMARNAAIGMGELEGEADDAAVALDGVGESADTAKTKVLGLNDIDLNLSGTVKGEIDKIAYYLAGGLDLQIVTDKIKKSLEAGYITPEQAQEMFKEVYAGAEGVEVRVGDITADEAAQNIKDTLGVSLDEAKLILDDILARFGAIPKELSTSLFVTEYHNVVNTAEYRNYNPGKGATVTPKAAGGPVMAGVPYLVGERGPEPFIPSTNGTIMPNNDFEKLLKNIKGGEININVYGAADPQQTAHLIDLNFRAAQALAGVA